MENKNNNVLTIILVLLVLVLGGTTGYFVYDKYFNKVETKENTTANTDTKKIEKELDITSSKVLNLYNLVDDYSFNYKYKEIKEETILVSDMDYNDMFLIALNNYGKAEYLDCNEIKSEFKQQYADSLDVVTCGENEYVASTDSFKNYNNIASTSTDFYKEDKINKLFHQIFGENYYQKKNVLSLGIEYMYSAQKQGYATLMIPTGGIGVEAETKLISAKEKEDSIEFVEELTPIGLEDNSKYEYKYTFNYNKDDDSYYFYSLEKTKK